MSPILYSFRRCPYAIRARMAIAHAGRSVELREVLLREKPAALLELSPKGTVPVLCLPDGRVIDESRDIMSWALDEALNDETEGIIDDLDRDFKVLLDAYKYPERSGADAPGARDAASAWLQPLNARLEDRPYYHGETLSKADMALLPFVRQFAGVDPTWFEAQDWSALLRWRDTIAASDLFARVMNKHTPWQPESPIIHFPTESIDEQH